MDQKVKGPLMYQLELPSTWKIYDTFYAVHLSPYNETPQYGPNETHPPPKILDNEEEYEVNHIVCQIKDNCFSLFNGKAMDQKTTCK